MKKLIFVVSIVFILFACDNGGVETIENPVTVTFDTDGGTDIAPMTVEAFSIIELPTPKKNGYEFIGWYVIQGGQKWLLSGSPYQYQLDDRDITFYARFVIWYTSEVSNISHTITEIDAGIKITRISFTWDNPTDANFSHVAIASSEFALEAYELEPGVNSYIMTNYVPLDLLNVGLIYVKCVDKNGNQSKGIRYIYYSSHSSR